MAKPAARKQSGSTDRPGDPIAAYARSKPPAMRAICDRLRALIDAEVPKASSKIWHGGPVWFVGENPVVGFDVTAKGVKLLFWNGRAFDDPRLVPVGKHRAAQVSFADAAAIDPALVRRWLRKARTDVLDSKAYVRKLREARQRAARRTAPKTPRTSPSRPRRGRG